jgi:lipid-A-disaccharide synthase
MRRKLLLVAGEVSGDQHAAALLDALTEAAPGLSIIGVGGDRCAASGMRLLAHQRDLAVVGVVEALGKILFARRLLHRCVEEARKESVDAAVLIDSPDFNLPLARRLAAAGIPVIFFVSPQVWAWRSGRARTLDRLGSKILVLFAFEKRWYDARGLGRKVTWVGHPLVDVAAEELKKEAPSLEGKRRRVVLMPGSREEEVRRLLPLMRDAVSVLEGMRCEVDVWLVRADSVSEELVREHAGDALLRWHVVSGPHLALLAASDVLLVASGTATIEGLLARVPMVVVYRVNPFTWWLARRLVDVPHAAMANLVSDDGSGTRTVPELLQHDATPKRIAAEAAAFLDDPARAAAARERLGRGASELGPPGAARRAADEILRILGAAPAAGAA